jgi:hypothetical protein
MPIIHAGRGSGCGSSLKRKSGRVSVRYSRAMGMVWARTKREITNK